MKARRSNTGAWKVAAVAAAFLLACAPLRAQRTMAGEVFFDLQGQYPCGGTLSVGRYVLPGYWDVTLELMRMLEPLRVDGAVGDAMLESWQAKAGGGLMLRFLSTRSRGLNLYAGASAWLGIEDLDPRRLLPADLVLAPEAGRMFVFGATPRLEAELFLGSRVALVVGGRLPVAVLSRIRYLTAEGTVGLRFVL